MLLIIMAVYICGVFGRPIFDAEWHVCCDIDTPLHLCILSSASNMVPYLLARNARDTLRVKNNTGATPLDLARTADPMVDLNACKLASIVMIALLLQLVTYMIC